MIVDKAAVAAVRCGQMKKQDLVNILLKNSVIDMAEALADYILADEQQKPVTVSQEDYDKIMSLFRVRGVRADGTIEKRGRK